MKQQRTVHHFKDFNKDEVRIGFGADRHGKPSIEMAHINTGQIALLTPAAQTFWPRCTGEGNFGTVWGPQEKIKTKYTLDLNDATINGEENKMFSDFTSIIDAIDDILLDFVFQNQLKILNRMKLSKDECRMLQIRSVRPKYDKITGLQFGKALMLSAPKYFSNGMGGHETRDIGIYDSKGNQIEFGVVSPGDVVAATMFINSVYTGVGGDKFGISWGFDTVQILCQRQFNEQRSFHPLYASQSYDFAMDYKPPVCLSDQFGEE